MNLAQVNLGWMRYPLDHPDMAGFVNEVDRINELAEQSPGFIWRYQTTEGDALSVRVFDDPTILYNCSVWRSPEDLYRYVYSTEHATFLAKAREWFVKPPRPPAVMWYTDSYPSVDWGCDKLRRLWALGSTKDHFTFRQAHDVHGVPMKASWRREARAS